MPAAYVPPGHVGHGSQSVFALAVHCRAVTVNLLSQVVQLLQLRTRPPGESTIEQSIKRVVKGRPTSLQNWERRAGGWGRGGFSWTRAGMGVDVDESVQSGGGSKLGVQVPEGQSEHTVSWPSVHGIETYSPG